MVRAMTRVLLFLLPFAAIGSIPGHSRAQRVDSTRRQRPFMEYHEADSIRLDRLRGAWGGPEYAIVVDRSERVSVRPDSVARSLFLVPAPKQGTFLNLMGRATMSLFAMLPDTLESDPVFGRVCATDSPTAVVTLYHRRLVKRVVDYLGCEWAPVAIRELERAIEEAAGRQPDK